MRHFFSIFFFIALAFQLHAGDKHVRAGAVGTGSGNDWNNAYTQLPVTLDRAHTYYIAGGSYPGYTYNTPASGSTVQNVIKATAGAHGSAVGWIDGYATQAAVFTAQIRVIAPYFTIDGVTGSFKSGHGIEIRPTTRTQAIWNSADYLTVKHVKVHWPSRFNAAYVLSYGMENNHYIEGVGFQRHTGLVVEDCYFTEIPGVGIRCIAFDNSVFNRVVVAHQSTTEAEHASIFIFRNGASTNGTISNCWIEDVERCTGVIAFYDDVHDGYKIFNNIITNYRVGSAGAIGLNIWNVYLNNSWIVNNTLHNWGNAQNNGGINLVDTCDCWPASCIGCPGVPSTGNIIANNIFYDVDWLIQNPGINFSWSHNYTPNCSSTFSFNPYTAGEPWLLPSQPKSSVNASPFVNAAGYNYNLAAEITGYPGLNLGAPFNVDRNGVTRGADGVWDRGAIEFVSGTPPTPDTEAPTVPTGVTVTAVSQSSLRVEWVSSADNIAVAGYNVLRNDQIVGTPSGTSFVDTGLAPATPYSYKIVARDTASPTPNHSAASSSASGTTLTVDVIAPTVPGNLSVLNEEATSVTLIWDPSTDAVGVTQYELFRGATLVGSPTVTNYTDSGLTPETAYQYQVRAVDGAGNSSDKSTAVTGTTTEAPDFPTSGLIMWLDASAMGGQDQILPEHNARIGTWLDQSGNGRHATQSTDERKPAWMRDIVNSQPTIYFSAESHLTFSYDPDGLTGMTIIMVAANLADQTIGVTEAENAAIFWNESASWGTVYLSPWADSVAFRFGTQQAGNRHHYTRPATISTNFAITTAIHDSGTDSLYVNSAKVVEATGKAATLNGNLNVGNLGRGYNNNSYFNGYISEVLLYARALAPIEREQVETYLSAKYLGTGGGGGGDTTAPTKPADLVATAFSHTRIDLTWSASTDAVGVHHYTVLTNGVAMADVTNPTTSYSAEGLVPDTSYIWRVVAVDAALNVSAQSDPQTRATPPTQAPSVKRLERLRAGPSPVHF